MIIKIRRGNIKKKLIPKAEVQVENVFKEILDYFDYIFTRSRQKLEKRNNTHVF